MVDPDILLLAIVNMSEGVKAFIGNKGAKLVLRDKENGNVVIEEDIFTDSITGENLSDSPITYFFAGLIEGFVSFISD